MTRKRKLATKFEPWHGYSKEDWVDVTDFPEITDEQWAGAKPFSEVFPEMAASIKRSRGRPPVENPKQHVSLRLDPDVIAKFKATGKGWQGRINEALRKAKL